jgi:hypothetical protein
MMEKKSAFTKLLAVGGTVLVWLPLLAPVVFSLLARRLFQFDYLMPVELFPIAFLGGGALLTRDLFKST